MFNKLLDDRIAVIDVILDVLWQVASCLLIKGLLVKLKAVILHELVLMLGGLLFVYSVSNCLVGLLYETLICSCLLMQKFAAVKIVISHQVR